MHLLSYSSRAQSIESGPLWFRRPIILTVQTPSLYRPLSPSLSTSRLASLSVCCLLSWPQLVRSDGTRGEVCIAVVLWLGRELVCSLDQPIWESKMASTETPKMKQRPIVRLGNLIISHSVVVRYSHSSLSLSLCLSNFPFSLCVYVDTAYGELTCCLNYAS